MCCVLLPVTSPQKTPPPAYGEDGRLFGWRHEIRQDGEQAGTHSKLDKDLPQGVKCTPPGTPKQYPGLSAAALTTLKILKR